MLRTNRSWIVILAIAIGLVMGAFDIHSTNDSWEILAYIGLGAGLGFLQPKRAWRWGAILAACLYLVHVWAIAQGYRPPYVERNNLSALLSYIVFFPTTLGAYLGVLLWVWKVSAQEKSYPQNLSELKILLNRDSGPRSIRKKSRAVSIAMTLTAVLLCLGTLVLTFILIDNERIERGRHAWTISSASDWVHNDPNNATAHSALGDAYLDQKQYNHAVKEYRTAVRLSPDDAAGHYYLGFALKEAGQENDALQEFQTTIKLDVSHDWPTEEASKMLQQK